MYLCRINCAANGLAPLLYVFTIILLFLYIIAIASRKRAGRVAEHNHYILSVFLEYIIHIIFLCPNLRLCTESGAALGIFDWGSKVRGSGGRKSSSGVQGQSPGRGSGGLCPPEAEALLKGRY